MPKKSAAADLEVEDIEDIEEEAPPKRVVKKAPPPPVDEDEDDDEEAEEDDDLDDDLDDSPPPVARQPPPIAKPPPAVTRPVAASPLDKEFDAAAKERKDRQTVDDYLNRKKAEETISVDEITELLLSGDQDKIVRELYQYCNDNLGIKKAKQLLREARDNAKARVTRISGCVGVILDELKSENEDKENG